MKMHVLSVLLNLGLSLAQVFPSLGPPGYLSWLHSAPLLYISLICFTLKHLREQASGVEHLLLNPP